MGCSSKNFEHKICFTQKGCSNQKCCSIFIVSVNIIDFWLFVISSNFIFDFSFGLKVAFFTNSSIFQVVIFIYIYVTCITITVHLKCKFYLQDKSELNRTEDIGTEQLLISYNRTLHISIEQNSSQ